MDPGSSTWNGVGKVGAWRSNVAFQAVCICGILLVDTPCACLGQGKTELPRSTMIGIWSCTKFRGSSSFLRRLGFDLDAGEDGIDDSRLRVTPAPGPRPFGAAIGFADAVLSSLRFAAVGWSRRCVASASRTWGRRRHPRRTPSATSWPKESTVAGSSCPW